MLREPRKRGQRLSPASMLPGTDRPSVVEVEIVSWMCKGRDLESKRPSSTTVAFSPMRIQSVRKSLPPALEDEEAVFVRQGQDIALYGDLER